MCAPILKMQRYNCITYLPLAHFLLYAEDEYFDLGRKKPAKETEKATSMSVCTSVLVFAFFCLFKRDHYAINWSFNRISVRRMD